MYDNATSIENIDHDGAEIHLRDLDINELGKIGPNHFTDIIFGSLEVSGKINPTERKFEFTREFASGIEV